MPNSGQFRFEPVSPDHYPMLRTWLSRPHWREWWGEPEAELETIRTMVEGGDPTRPYLIVENDKPLGYIQRWRVEDQADEKTISEHPWLTRLPGKAVGIDLSIGDEADLSKGKGSAVLAAFMDKLRSDGATIFVIDPDRNNQRAVRAYSKAGFRPVPGLEALSGDALIMQNDPDTSEHVK